MTLRNKRALVISAQVKRRVGKLEKQFVPTCLLDVSASSLGIYLFSFIVNRKGIQTKFRNGNLTIILNYIYIYIYIYIVTCQPIVGLHNRALLGSRPVNKILRSRDNVTLQE
jgi:hypothetical protein